MSAIQGAAKAYVEQNVLTASKEKLVILLYEAAIRELERANARLAEPGATARVGEALGTAYSIVSELKAALDLEAGGEIAEKLDQLYSFVQARITKANRLRSDEPIGEALKVLMELKEGWDGILRSA